jgi:CheY-like chemotaxis protein
MHETDQLLLLVEDSDVDYEATVRSLRRSGFAYPIYRCTDGDDALDYLFHRGRYDDPRRAPRPALILLDLNLPGTDGREILAEIKQCEGLRSIPVVVLTTSVAERDIVSCYVAGANSYIQKPIDFGEFTDAIEALKKYWFEIVILPGSV